MAHSRPVRFTNWYLKEWLASLKVSQSELVERTDLSKTTISLLCNSRQDYTPAIVRDIAYALNVRPHELLMHPDDAMALRQLRREALTIVEATRQMDERTGTDN